MTKCLLVTQLRGQIDRRLENAKQAGCLHTVCDVHGQGSIGSIQFFPVRVQPQSKAAVADQQNTAGDGSAHDPKDFQNKPKGHRRSGVRLCLLDLLVVFLQIVLIYGLPEVWRKVWIGFCYCNIR